MDAPRQSMSLFEICTAGQSSSAGRSDFGGSIVIFSRVSPLTR